MSSVFSPFTSDTSSNETSLNVSVSEGAYIPNTSENLIYEALKNTKVSFVLLLLIVIAIYIGIFFLLGNESSENPTSPMKKTVVLALEVVLWVMLIFVVYVNLQNYDAENYDFRAKMSNLFNSKIAELEVSASHTDVSNSDTGSSSSASASSASACSSTTGTNNDGTKEVFHIAQNKYTFDEAKDVCEEYGATLATYDEVERAYNNGANWCSYGWSKDQLALFPTQKEVYNELKKLPGHEHDCGRPGINGGFFLNPKVKFGVNCYGVKPKAKPNDESYMHALNHTPKVKDVATLEQVRANRMSEYIVAPFNKNKWSKV